MTELSEEIKEKNYNLFVAKLQKVGVDLSNIDKEIAEKIKNAPFGMNAHTNTAYEGAFIDIVLKTLTVYAVKINELLPDNVKAEINSLVKVCLLHQLSKAEMFIKNDNEKERERGILYKYAPSKVALKMGFKSLLMAQNLGVKFTDEEAEAMTILDRNDDDNQSKFFASPLSVILKQAANLTFLKVRIL